VKPLVLLAALTVPFVGVSAHADEKSAVDPLDGTWKPVTAQFAGQPFPDEVLKTMKLVVDKGKYTVFVGDQADEGTVVVDPKKSPKTMDITGTKGPNQGKTMLAIYEFKGGDLRVCYDLGGKARPTEFASQKESQLFLVTYQMVKP
jgi:uncharacterized protein (TIGR03067 family)